MKNFDSKKREFVPIGFVIDSLLSSYQKTTKTTAGKLVRIVDVWSEVTGSVISENTKPTAMKDRLLLVNVTSSVWMQQLQYMKNDLIVRVNAALGAEDIENIKFKIGKV
jgi:predicted nucleic acid-binding Zn ribbon protein